MPTLQISGLKLRVTPLVLFMRLVVALTLHVFPQGKRYYKPNLIKPALVSPDKLIRTEVQPVLTGFSFEPEL
jgi:hypothetical protein